MDKNQEDCVGSTHTMQTEYCIFSSQFGDEEEKLERSEDFQLKAEYPSLNKINSSDYIIENEVNNLKDNFDQHNEESFFDIKNIEKEKFDCTIEQIDFHDKPEENSVRISENLQQSENNFQNFIQFKNKENEIPSLIKLIPDVNSFYEVKEKCEIKDYIGSHKIYEISLYNSSLNEKKIKSFRRYHNFYKFDQKIKKSFPYYIIPRLPPKNPLAKIIPPDNEFFENRKTQLSNYINFLWRTDLLSKTKEFLKFVNEADFDEEFFENEEINYNYFAPESSKINDTFSNKLYGMFSQIFSSSENEKRINEPEKNLKRMEMHYKFLTDKCNNIKDNTNVFLKSIKKNSEIFNKLSGNSLYLKDTMERIENSNENFKKFEEISSKISESNHNIYFEKGIKIKNEIESYVSILYGICDAFERYSEYTKLCEKIIKAERYSKANRMDNYHLICEELKQCEIYKMKFEQNLLDEINTFNKNYNVTFINLIEEFKILVKEINSAESLISLKIVN